MDTIREIIIKDIIARLAVIRIEDFPASGYYTDCGENVYRARKTVDPDNLPCSNVIPQPETAEKLYGKVKHIMPVRIEGISFFGKEAVTRGLAVIEEDSSVVSERILGDLIKAMTSQSWSRSPDYIESINYKGGGTDEYPDEGSVTVGASAIFEIIYWTAAGDPYTP